jgi:hypothetical protein
MSSREARKNAEDAIREIRKYSPSNDRHALLRRVVLGENTTSKNVDDFIFELQSLIDGGLFAKDFIEKIESFSSVDNQNEKEEIEKTIKKTVRITVPDKESVSNLQASYLNGKFIYNEFKNEENGLLTLEKGNPLPPNTEKPDGNSFKNPSKTNTSLVAFEILNPRISINARETDTTSIFLSLIPTLELSRCVPYINVALTSDTPSNENDGKLSGLSLVSFLSGKDVEIKNLSSLDRFSSLGLRQSGTSNESVPGPASMELFTSPQTLVPVSDSVVFAERKNIPKVLDRFRPFMSLVSLNVSVKPTNGFMSYKTATMELVLHDRSRLHEIGSFIRPGVNNKTELTIEYGWSNNFSGTSDQNPFAVFMNSLKIKEKYGIVNSSFRFDDSGQVNITLHLFTKGVQQMEQIPVASFGAESREKELFEILEKISEIIQGNKGTTKLAKLFDETLIESFSSSSSLLSLSDKELSKLKKTFEKIKNSQAKEGNRELVSKIRSVLGDGSSSGALDLFKKSVDDAVNKELSSLNKGEEIFACNLSQYKGFKSISFPSIVIESRTGVSQQRQLYDEEVKERTEKLKKAALERSINEAIESDQDIIRLRIERNELLGFDLDFELKNGTVVLDNNGFPSRAERGVAISPGITDLGKKIRSFREAGPGKALRYNALQKEIRQIRNEYLQGSRGKIREFETGIESQVKKELAANGITRPTTGQPASRTIQTPISLGRLLTSFVGKPLRKSGSFDEIQFMFYPFNEKASFVRQMSIAKFPIDYNDVKKKIVEQIQKNPKISVMNILRFIIEEFVNNMSVKPYGFSFLYEDEKDDEGKSTGRLVRKKAENDTAKKKEQEKQDEILKLAGIKDGKFKLPNVQIIPECVPYIKDSEKTILRLHVIDTHTTSHDTLFNLMKSIRQGSFADLSSEHDGPHPLLPESPELKDEQLYQERNELIKELIKVAVPPETVIDAGGGSSEIDVDIGKLLEGKTLSQTKKFVSEGVPTIFLGGSSGAIKSIGLSSMSDSRLSTVNMLRAENEPDLSSVIRDRGLPMKVLPVECNIETLGFPLFERMQNFFIDFGTGTTADNVYVVNEIEHKLGPGEFSTSLKMIFLESFMNYESSNRKVRIANSILEKDLGPLFEVPIAASSKPVGTTKHLGSQKLLTLSNSIPVLSRIRSARNVRFSKIPRLLIALYSDYNVVISPLLNSTEIGPFDRSVIFNDPFLGRGYIDSRIKFLIEIPERFMRGSSTLVKKMSNNISSASTAFRVFEIKQNDVSPASLNDIRIIERKYGPTAGVLKKDFPSPEAPFALIECIDFVNSEEA